MSHRGVFRPGRRAEVGFRVKRAGLGGAGENGMPNFDREKCVHCGACLWNCATASPENPERMAVAFRAGTGGLHSAEN